MELTSQCAAQELIRRRRVRLSLAEWARYKGFEPAKHHLLIINEIEAFLSSEDEVLLLFAPPGSAKSTYVSVLFPAWYWLTTPQRAFWQQRTRSSLPKGGDVVSETILQMKPKLSASSLLEIAKQPPDGALQAGANITALALASAFLAFGLTLAWATISSEVVRTLTLRR